MKGFLDNARVAFRCWRHNPAKPIPGADEAIGWTKPPAQSPPPGPRIPYRDAAALTQLHRNRACASPAAAQAARIIADGLRIKFPRVNDTTLGLIALDLYGYIQALALGLPDPVFALHASAEAVGLAAEELTRLARLDTPLDR